MMIYNGQWMAQHEPVLSPANRSFRYGDGLFETIRVYRGQAIFLADHLDRLREGMMLLGYRVAWEGWSSEVRDSIQTMIGAQEAIGPGRLRLHVWRAGGGTYRPEQDGAEYLIEYRALDREFFQTPQVVTCSDYHGVGVYPNALSRIKTASSLPYVLAARQARDSGTDEALLMNHRKEIAEASSSNVFIFRKRKLLTPGLNSGCLDGLMRRRVIDIAQTLRFEVEERALKQRDLASADAFFLTNSIRGIQAVSHYQSRTWTKNNWRHVQLLQKGLLDLADALVS